MDNARRNTDKRNNDKGSEFSEELICALVDTIRNISYNEIKKYISSLNIELYRDMKISKINEIKNANDEIIKYTYDVVDNDIDISYEDIESKSSDTYAVGDIVRVYISNITYIGFKV